MKPIIPSALRRVAVWLPAFSLMLAPLAAQAERPEDPERDRSQQLGELGGRAGIIEEFNLGPVGMDFTKQRQARLDEQENRVLSGRVIELKGQTLYVEREGVVVPLDVSALRITKQPKPGQEIVASYAVEKTRNIALSLAGEVARAR